MSEPHLDGYRPQLVRAGPKEYALHVEVVVGGEVADSRPTALLCDHITDRGEALRRYHLCAAICRYLNTGGDALGLPAVMGAMDRAIGDLSVQVQLPDNIDLMFTCENASRMHLFAMPDNKFLRVVEGQFTEELDAAQAAEVLGGE